LKYKILLDTCVWLDLAEDFYGDEILKQLGSFVENGCVELLKLDIIDAEFHRNKEGKSKGLSSSIRTRVADIRKFTKHIDSPTVAKEVLEAMDILTSQIEPVEELISKRFSRIEQMLQKATRIKPSKNVLQNTIDRGLDKRAPFGRKNSVADSIIIEAFGELAEDQKLGNARFAFITSNTTDFSDKKNHKLPHQDLSGFFKSNIDYSINVAEYLSDIAKEINTQCAMESVEVLITEDVIKHTQEVVENKMNCPRCRLGALIEQGWVRTGSGLSWCLKCSACNLLIETGEYDD
jgi:hypothetical protein